MSEKHPDSPLSGTTLKIYRILYTEGRPIGLNDIQKKASLSSASVAHYHVSKLINQGLVIEKDGRYFVEKAVFENMIRIRRSLVPLQTTLAIFFATTLFGLLFLVKPHGLSSLFVLALIVNVVALGIFLYQTFDTLRKWKI
ncbi:MAG: winged helix-turn-helix domain-containing protein [Nitrososphaerota archaeon]|nr:winged helix-turn-helix domain-containing protein [Nitrososphaerota archaeon]